MKINDNKSSSTLFQEFISAIQNSYYLQTTRSVTKSSLKLKIYKLMFNKVAETSRKPAMVTA